MSPPDDHRTRPDFTPTIPFESDPLGAPLPPPAPPALQPGHLLAGRFRILRFIAQGGMGEVWEAEDLELPGERVALKTIRPAIARDAWAMGRFRREIQLGRKVTHPNVCRIFDVFHHRPGAGGAAGAAESSQITGPDGEITFLTMELLAGETLEERLERDGRMSSAEALPIVRHMAAALQAAHEAEISHGDFKSSNVMLIGSGDSLRAVVTDFGLSRGGGAAAGLMTSVPVGDNLVGTPAYMAPEQVRGGRSSAAADIYALGIVMFEMLTGRLPFQAETAISSAVMRLTSPPPPPRTLVPDLDPRWESVVLRCLALEPGDRFERAADIARALEPDAPVVTLPRSSPDRALQRRWRWLAGAGAAILILGLTLGVLWRQRSQPEPSPGSAAVATASNRPAIAVLGFKNVSGRPDAAWLSTALSEMLATELAAGNQMRVIPSENVARMRVELGLADFSTLAGDTLGRVRGILGSDLVVLGSYTVLGPEPDAPIRLDLSLQDAAAGQTRTLPARSATASELFELVRASGADLRRALGTAELAPQEAEGALAAFSAEPEAARLYAEGLALLRRFESEAARAVLERAVEADPKQPLAHAALAAAWSAAGYDQRATAQARRAFELSRALPLEQRLEVEGRYREIAGEWPQAIEIYRTLYGNYPDHLDYGLRLVEAQVAAGAGAQARSTLEQLRRLPGPAGGDPRLDLAAAQIAEALSEFAKERDAARRAAEGGRASGARLLVARALLAQSWALRNLDELDAAKTAAQEARTIYGAAGDRAGAAQAVNQLGIITWQSGDLESAQRLYDDARAAFAALGDRRGVARALNNTAILLWERQDWSGARAIYERVVEIHRETGSKRHLASTLNNLGIVLREEGRLQDAVRTHREALQIQRETGELQGQALSLNNLAQALELQGDVAGARAMTVEALGIFRDIGSKASAADALINIAVFDQDRDLARAAAGYTEAVALKREARDQRGLATALTGLGTVLRLRGQLADARRHQEEALALRQELGEIARPFVSEIELARLSLEEGDSSQGSAAERAERTARSAAAAAEGAGDQEATAEALLVLAQALLRQGRLPESARLLREGASAAERDPAARLGYAITTAQLQAAESSTPAPPAALQKVIAEAERLHLPEIVFEARLAQAEIALATDISAGRTALTRVRDDAAAQGFGALAARAARQLAGVPH